MRKNFVKTLLIMSLFATAGLALNNGDIGTDRNGNAYLVVMQNDKGVFARKINLKALAKLDHIFANEVEGKQAATTVPNHKPFVSGKSNIELGLKRAMLVRATVTKCYRPKTVVQVQLFSEEAPPASQSTPAKTLEECAEALADAVIEL